MLTKSMLPAGLVLLAAGLVFRQSGRDVLPPAAAADRAAAVGRAGTAAQTETDLSQYYGFRKLEIYKLEMRSGNLLAADMNQDGRTDLMLVDNSNSRLDLLQQRDKPAQADPVVLASGRVNFIADDWRFEHRKIGVDKAVGSLAAGDFNADGRKDIAYLSDPDLLTVRLQGPDGDWTNPKRFRLPGLNLAQWIMAAGDLNGDGKDDLVVIAKHDTYLLYQQADGDLASPVKVMNTTENLGLAQIADLDGDGRNDLCYLSSDDQDRPLCARLQDKTGRLGAEIRYELPRPRGVTLANIDGKPGHELLAIEAQTGRVKVYQLQRPDVQAGEFAGQLIQYGFGQQGVGRNRDLATGDVNGDGRKDVVVTDPESAQMIVFLQRADSGLDQGNMYPGLMGAEQVRIGDVSGDPAAEVIVLSAKEKSIGVSHMEGGRLTFPEAIPVDKEPVALDLADINGDGRPEIVYLSKERTGQSSKYFLQATGFVKDEWKPREIGKETSTAVTLKGTPERLVALDANRDGRSDFMIFLSGDRAPLLLLATAEGKLQEVTGEGGFGLGSVSSGGFSPGMLDKPVLLMAQNSFARNVELGDNNQWRVVDQYNAAETEARIVGAATINLDSEPGNEIVLVDLGVKKLRVLHKADNVYRPWREIDIGPFPYKSTHVVDLNGDGQDDLLLFGTGKFGVLYAGQSDPRLKSLASYETKLEKVHFNDLVAGDLNSDGRMDVAVIDTQSQYIEILDYLPETGLRHALYFKVFEAKSIAGAEHAGSDPRESVIADVTGDGRPDLVLLSHDRVLVYPQDDGKPDAKAETQPEAQPARKP